MKLISNKGSHAPKAKSAALIIAIALILAAVVGGTVAYIVAHTGPVINTFTPSSADITVEENVDGNQKTSITVKNTGVGVPVYIRVALVANKIDADGNITGAAAVPEFTLGSDWVKHTDGYYYYTKPVSPGGKTGDLLGEKKITLTENMQVIILADAIQSVPVAAVQEAWGSGFSIDTDGTLKVPTSEGGAQS